jgi:uncharacterized protein
LLAYQTTPVRILELAESGRLVEEVADHLASAGYQVDERERNSWRQSLPALAGHLCGIGFGNLDALVEYQLPRSSRRIDVILAGAAPVTMRPTYLVVELKQWSGAWSRDGDAGLLRVSRMEKPQLHPAVQVEGYCAYLVDHLERLREWPESVHGMAYLHNAATRDRIPDRPQQHSFHNMVYTPDRAAEFRAYLERRFTRERDGRAAHRLLTSPVRQSGQLLAFAGDEVANRRHFTLLDEQREAYELVMRGVRWAGQGRAKRVIVVSGGPGSGKSAIGLSLLADLARDDRQVVHATGSRAFTRTLQKYARSQPEDPLQRTRPLFSYFMDFMAARPDSIDVLICDEAHRIRQRSRKGSREGDRPQVEELIEVARVPVFLLDDHQVVRPDEVGSVETIVGAADRLGLEVDRVHLDGQFRCGGSPRYERWVRHLLGLPGAGDPYPWSGDADRFRLALAADPEEMEAILRRCQELGQTARISAGFCWPWTHRARAGRLVPDVTIGAWARPWNASEDYPPNGIPASAYWATDPRGFDQIGCIYTAQGFEYDWSGVIMGNDLVVRNGRFISQPAESRDPEIMGRDGRRPVRNPDRLIRNTYKVLLTRGLRGTLIHSVDPETQAFLANLIPVPRRRGVAVAPGVHRIGAGSPVPGSPHQPTAPTSPPAPSTRDRTPHQR